MSDPTFEAALAAYLKEHLRINIRRTNIGAWSSPAIEVELQLDGETFASETIPVSEFVDADLLHVINR